ncbi:MAG: glycosyltransferase family 39 protein, partial [Flavobacteriales bacterium]|nr:glycosyltransferase family 39 protein [Flavobacteriales bacterium]
MMHSTTFRKPSLHLVVLILVMTSGVVMRFWNAFEIPLTYDEYSSLYRAQVAGFQEVLDQGILTDAHPAFTNTFLYVWLKVAHTPFLIKLPFLLLSCMALWLTYINGRNWLGPRAGLLGAALLSVGEFPLMYSQIARPYSVGLFSVVFSMWALHRFLHDSRWSKAVVLGIALAFGAYVHHFLALIGLVLAGYAAYAKWRSLRSLIPVLVTGIVLYFPQLLITLHQLGHKGIGTVISTPDIPWLAHHFSYIGNHDLLWKVCLLFLLGITISKWKLVNRRHLLVFLTIWLAPLFVGWTYSVAVAPVLQDRVLIFGLPALFVVIAAGMDYLKPHLAYATILIITCLGIYSTAANRDYYALFYANPFSGVVA